MVMASGIVVDGKIVVTGQPLAEGTRVTILAPGADDQGFLLGPEDEAALLESIEEADRGEVISGEDLLAELGSVD